MSFKFTYRVKQKRPGLQVIEYIYVFFVKFTCVNYENEWRWNLSTYGKYNHSLPHHAEKSLRKEQQTNLTAFFFEKLQILKLASHCTVPMRMKSNLKPSNHCVVFSHFVIVTGLLVPKKSHAYVMKGQLINV